MRQKIVECHGIDWNEMPAGGVTTAVGLEITWQKGPLGREPDRTEPNGCFVETVIAAALGRLTFYQEALAGKFKCRENALAITKLEEALHWLKHRTDQREIRGVEGTHQP